ncbi:MAG: hypothetical protein ACE14L_00145 [Terriglobales bacterium]
MKITAKLDASAAELVGFDGRVVVRDKRGKRTGEFIVVNLSNDQAFILAREDAPFLSGTKQDKWAEERGIAWRGYYSFRRGVATKITGETKDALAAKGLLRHTSVATTAAHYIKDVVEATKRAVELINQQALALMKKRAEEARNSELDSNQAATQAAAEFTPSYLTSGSA